MDALERVTTPKGEYIAIRRRIPGRAAADLLQEACPQVIRQLHFAKMMRWGDVGFRFVRPIRWIVALLGRQVVTFEVAGVRSGKRSRGHRRLGSRGLDIASPRTYVDTLHRGEVMPDPARRREAIRSGLEEASRAIGGDPRPDEDLLEILVHMTEWPSVISGSFPAEYLELPREVLVTVMRHHQHYFSVARSGDGADELLPAFLAVLAEYRKAPEVTRRTDRESSESCRSDTRYTRSLAGITSTSTCRR